MKLPNPLHRLHTPKKVQHEYFLSLILDIDAVAAGIWHMQGHGFPVIVASATVDVPQDTWEDRIIAVDRVISKLEETVHTTTLQKVILGLPAAYLTDQGDIQKSVRSEIKKMTQELELTPIGFVSLYQALVHKFKKDEGVPPSVILLGISGEQIAVSVYKVGALIGQGTITDNDITIALETIFKSLKDVELLPARMLLYGGNHERLEQLKRELLRHPWQNKVNFLHFPKIEIVSKELPITAVTFAGASELASSLGDMTETDEADASPEETEIADEVHAAEEIVTESAPVLMTDLDEIDDETNEKIDESEEISEASNVVMVNPSLLGFKKPEPLTAVHQTVATPSRVPLYPVSGIVKPEIKDETKEDISKKNRLSNFFSTVKNRFHTDSDDEIEEENEDETPAQPEFSPGKRAFPVRMLIIILFIVFIIAGGGVGIFWFLPHATVTVYTIPKIIEKTETITIDPAATAADANNKVIPGTKEERTVSGEKTIAATGKKKVGTPAKGTVIIYNKSTVSRTFKKGTVLTAGSLQFSIDSEVQVASASENLAQSNLIYGKVDAALTAVSIGSESNLAAGTDLSFKDTSSSIAVARNDQGFAGGTSRDILVVSRADQDALVKAVTQDLIDKAKQELASSVGGGQKLIEETIKTTVTEKKFLQELDQEAKEVHGTITMKVSGISYKDDDVKALVGGIFTTDIPNGYAIAPSRTTAEVKDVQVKKDASMTLTGVFKAWAIPTLDAGEIRNSIVGKNLAVAEENIKKNSAVGSVHFDFRLTPFKQLLPLNRQNITVTIAIQE